MSIPIEGVAQIEKSYLDNIFQISDKYLKKALLPEDYDLLASKTSRLRSLGQQEVIDGFLKTYREIVKNRHRAGYEPVSREIEKFISHPTGKVKAIWGDCLSVMKEINSESIQLVVTSPPYYNAREYSQWATLDDYLNDMNEVIKEIYRTLDNHRAVVWNVGDITGNDNRETSSTWGSRRIPLSAYFINIFEEAGFRFIDDFIWDKGEVQSSRHKNGNTPYPLYQYPLNCYEHILIFHKHRQDKTPYPCPVCGCLKVNGNAYSGVGVKSWECKNLKCFERSASNRGKRFSLRSIILDELRENEVSKELVKKWRRDIVPINPTIKINSKGENTLGHTAPFPPDIPEFAINTLSGKGEIVIDPFAGSFTSPIQAVKAGRIGIGVELNKKMFKSGIVKNIRGNSLELEEFKE